MTSAPLIELHRVSKSFDGGRGFAVNDLSLTINRGSLIALVGASGSGKTTTCKFINRLIDPDAGEVRIDQRTVASIPPAELRRGIGYVFQGIGLFPHMRVGENIGITPQLLGGLAPTSRRARLNSSTSLVCPRPMPPASRTRSPEANGSGLA